MFLLSQLGRRFTLSMAAICIVLWMRVTFAPKPATPFISRMPPPNGAAAAYDMALPSSISPPPPPPAVAVAASDNDVLTKPHAHTATSPSPICALPEFSPASPRLDISVFVFAWRRLASLKRLVNSLQSAEYCGFNLSFTVLLDVGAAPAVVEYARAVRWAHGRYRVVEEPPPPGCAAKLLANSTSWGAVAGACVGRGIRGMWIEVMGRELSRHEPAHSHPLPLEDDTEVSPLFYWWLRRAHRAYGPFGTAGGGWKRSGSTRNLVGISLYSPRLDEIHYPQRPWRPRWPSAVRGAPCFLFCLPCSWGALYFRAQWEAFLTFYRLRTAPPFYDFASEVHQKGKLAQREPLGDRALVIRDSRAS